MNLLPYLRKPKTLLKTVSSVAVKEMFKVWEIDPVDVVRFTPIWAWDEGGFQRGEHLGGRGLPNNTTSCIMGNERSNVFGASSTLKTDIFRTLLLKFWHPFFECAFCESSSLFYHGSVSVIQLQIYLFIFLISWVLFQRCHQTLQEEETLFSSSPPLFSLPLKIQCKLQLQYLFHWLPMCTVEASTKRIIFNISVTCGTTLNTF